MPANKPTILYLITQSELGGAQLYVYNLAKYLQSDFDIQVGSGGQANDWLPRQLKNIGVKWLPIKHLKRPLSPLSDLKSYWEIKKLINKTKPDIIHLNSSKISILGSLAAKKDSKIVYTAHGWVFNEPLPALLKNFYLAIEKITARRKDKIICVSEFDRQTALKANFNPAKLTTITNGIDTSLTVQSPPDKKQELLAKLKLPASSKLIGTIANLYPTKNITRLIQAAALLKASYPHLVFVIIGSGPEQDKLTRLINQYHLSRTVILMGHVKQADYYLPGFDLFVLPSLKEGLPYSLLEAMRVGLPIVASRVGGMPEILSSYPASHYQLINPTQPDQIAQAIAALLEKPKLPPNQLAETFRQIDITNQISKTKQIYLSLLKQ